MTFRDFWNLAFLAALERFDAKEAAHHADQMVEIAHNRWSRYFPKRQVDFFYNELLGAERTPVDPWDR